MVTERRRRERARSLQGALEGVSFHNPIGQRTAAKWDTLASHVLHADIEDGEDESDTASFYHFTDPQRDRLIAHARQDAAHAVFGVYDAYKAARDARMWSWFSFLMNIIMLGILVYAFLL